MEIKSSKFDFNFFLSSKRKVTSLEEGAKEYGGATQLKDEIFSNYGEMDIIQLNEDTNEIGIFIPSTYDIDTPTDNTSMIEFAYFYMDENFDNLEITTGKGSWYSHDRDRVILEDITVIKAYCKDLTEDDIRYVMRLAEIIKRRMQQEGVSISINDALAIV